MLFPISYLPVYLINGKFFNHFVKRVNRHILAIRRVIKMEGITDSMRQYTKSTEEIYMNKPKRGKPYGINKPNSDTLVGFLSVLFVLIVLAAEFVD